MKQSDKVRAQRLLMLRQDRAAFRVRHIGRGPRLWLTVAVVVGLAAYSIVGDLGLIANRAVWLVVGIFIGRVIRDWIWLRDVVDGFPFLEKVLDWRAVQALAEERDPGPESG